MQHTTVHLQISPAVVQPAAELDAAGTIARSLHQIAALAEQASTPEAPAIARILAVRGAHAALERGWLAFALLEDEARFSGAAYLAEDLDAGRNALALAADRLARLEAALVGEPAPLARLAAARPRAAAGVEVAA